MAKKFSLKDNPIFQRLEVPQPKEPQPSTEEIPPLDKVLLPHDIGEPSSEGQNMTLRNRPSETDSQQLVPTTQENIPAQALTEPVAPLPVPPPPLPDPELKNHLEKSLFFNFFNEVVDELLPMLNLSEQVLYNRFFRLSYGFHRNYCTVSQPLLMERTGLSRNTVRTTLQSLLQKGWIKITGAGNRRSTTYRVVLPREKREGDKASGSIFEDLEGQNLDLQNLTPRELNAKNHCISTHLQTRGSKFEGQRSTLWSLILSARELVEKFYSHLGQRPSKTQREKSIQECLSLFEEGFTVEEVDYAISWFVEHDPTADSFSSLIHFIDQALSDRRGGKPKG